MPRRLKILVQTPCCGRGQSTDDHIDGERGVVQYASNQMAELTLDPITGDGSTDGLRDDKPGS